MEKLEHRYDEICKNKKIGNIPLNKLTRNDVVFILI